MKNRYPTAEAFLPSSKSITSLRCAAKDCKGCDLYKPATQTVFGEGPVHAEIMLVGEQPGDQEDLTGSPFVGPAGRLLDTALGKAGVDRKKVYVTNAVKHFKFEPRGKRRLHKKPTAAQINACKPWLREEIERIGPEIIVALGLTAAYSLLGRAVTLSSVRGELQVTDEGWKVLVTTHPSALLRIPSHDDRTKALEALIDDLKTARKILTTSSEGPEGRTPATH